MKTELWPCYSSPVSARYLCLGILVCCAVDHLLTKIVSVDPIVPTTRANRNKLLASCRRVWPTNLLAIRGRHAKGLILKRMSDSHL